MSNAESEKCACPDCVCTVHPDEALTRDGKRYCGTACADGHRDGSGCGHRGCNCHG